MDARELKRRAEKAREFDHKEEAEGFGFVVRIPGSVEMRAYLREASVAGVVNFDRLYRSLVPACVVSWQGPTAGHLVKDLPAEEAKQPLPCEAALIEELLGERPQMMDRLAGELAVRYTEREAAKAAAAKNS